MMVHAYYIHCLLSFVIINFDLVLGNHEIPRPATIRQFTERADTIPHVGYFPCIAWQRVTGNCETDRIQAVSKTQDGGYIMAGYKQRSICLYNPYAQDFWIVRLTPFGDVKWSKQIGGSAQDFALSVIETNDLGFLVGGLSNSPVSDDKTEPNRGISDYWIIKLDSLGELQWQKVFGGSDSEWLLNIKQTKDNGYVLAGFSKSGISGDKIESSRGGNDFWIIKVDEVGTEQWQKTIGGNRNEELYALSLTMDNGLIIGGNSSSNISGEKNENCRGEVDYWIVKMNEFGQIQWQKTLGGSGRDVLKSIVQIDSCSYILGGESNSNISGDKNSPNFGGLDFWILKLTGPDSIIWQRTYGGNKTEYFQTISLEDQNTIVLSGISDSNITGNKTEVSQGDQDLWLLEIDDYANLNWQKTIGGNDGEVMLESFSVETGLIVFGNSWSSSSGDKKISSPLDIDIWMLKLETDPNCHLCSSKPVIYSDYYSNSSSWLDPLNWTNKSLPKACNNVIIPTGRKLKVGAGQVLQCKTLNIQIGSELCIDYYSSLIIDPNQ